MNNKPSKAEVSAIAQMMGLGGGDQEYEHVRADEILVEYLKNTGSTHVAEAYEKCRDRVGFWYA